MTGSVGVVDNIFLASWAMSKNFLSDRDTSSQCSVFRCHGNWKCHQPIIVPASHHYSRCCIQSVVKRATICLFGLIHRLHGTTAVLSSLSLAVPVAGFNFVLLRIQSDSGW